MSNAPTYITVDANSPAFVVYHDHSYFIRHESTHPTTDTNHRRKASTPTVTNNPTTSTSTVNHSQSQPPVNGKQLPSVQVLNQLLLQHQQQQQQKNPTSTSVSSSSASTMDLAAILRAFLHKQTHHLPTPLARETIETNITDAASSLPSSTAASWVFCAAEMLSCPTMILL